MQNQSGNRWAIGSTPVFSMHHVRNIAAKITIALLYLDTAKQLVTASLNQVSVQDEVEYSARFKMELTEVRQGR